MSIFPPAGFNFIAGFIDERSGPAEAIIRPPVAEIVAILVVRTTNTPAFSFCSALWRKRNDL
jgi:hypothetical protein